jgi:lysophospholipase L1-like esterase
MIRNEIENDEQSLFIDVWRPMLDQHGEPKKEIFQPDGLHLNALGYKIWRETLYSAIKKGFKANFR